MRRGIRHRLAVWLGLVADKSEPLDVPGWLAAYYRSERAAPPVSDPAARNGILQLEAWLRHPASDRYRRPR